MSTVRQILVEDLWSSLNETGSEHANLLARAKTTTTKSSTTKGGGKSSTYRNQIPYVIWYTIAGVIFALAVIHWGSRAFSYWTSRTRRQQARARRTSQETNEKHTEKTPAKPIATPVRVVDAIKAAWANNMYLRVLPLWLYSSTSVAELFWTVAYAGITTGWVCWALVGDKRTDALGRLDFANPFGMAAYAQVPLIIGLASRNNVISFLTGISYQKLNYLHRATARVCLLHSWIHVYGRITLGVGAGTKFALNAELMIGGMIAIGGITVAFLTSFRVVRHYLYEFFLITHIVFILAFLLGAFYHYERSNQYIWPGILLWAVDRFASLLRMVWVNKAWFMLAFGSEKRKQSGQCTVELVDPDVMRVTVKTAMRWKAGQHAFITMPSVATLRYEQHPFTIASADSTDSEGKRRGEAVFLVRTYDGFTRRLRDAIESEKTTSIKAYLDGPYGCSPSLVNYDTVVLLAGGTGISYTLAHLLELLDACRRDAHSIRHIRLVWNIRHLSHVSWIAPMLNDALRGWKSDLDLQIVLHVTKSHMADEPFIVGRPTDQIAHGIERVVTHTHEKTKTPDVGHTPARSSGEGSESGSVPSQSTQADNEKSAMPASDAVAMSEKPATALTVGDMPTAIVSSQTLVGSGSSNSLTPAKFPFASFGLTEDVAPFIAVAKGRVHMDTLLEDVVRQAQGSIHVSVCGPEELALASRTAVTRINTIKRIMKGQHAVEFYEESYGW